MSKEIFSNHSSSEKLFSSSGSGHNNPLHLFILTIVAICIADAILLMLFPAISSFFPLSGRVITALLLALVSLPVVYYLLYRPLLLNISASKATESNVRLAYKVLESSSEPILITDEQAAIEYVNPAFCTITGYTAEEVIGKNPGIMKSGKHDAEFYREMWTSLRKTGQWQGEIWDKRRNGEIYPKWLSISAVRDEHDTVVKYVGVFSDITSLKQTEAHLEYLAHYDSLTNMPNRLLFRDRLNQAIRRAARSKHIAAVMMIDLNRFKHINDTFGHLAGDQLLREYSERISGCLRKEDTLARLGGDEFAIILDGVTASSGVEFVARKIIEAMAGPFMLKGHEVFMTTSIGIALYPQDGGEIDTLLRNADMAMYLSKEQGDNKYHFYEQSIGDQSFERLSIETNLRHAIEREEFVLHYQPQIDLSTGRIIGMEALIRRQEADWLVPPGRFIPLAEDTGLIIPICEWTLRKACQQNKIWQEQGLPSLRVAVNVTASQLFSIKLLKTVERILAETNLDPQFLELELTERVIIRDSQTAIHLMRELKDMGICLSIDDFGTGYSSLSYLNRLPIDKLKVDQSFIRDCISDQNSASIVKAIIALSHSLNMKVIAEGVETGDQLSFLREQECDEIQGYYFSVPLPVEAFRSLVLSGKKLEA